MVNVLIMHKQNDLVTFTQTLNHQGHFEGERYEVLVVALIQESLEVFSLVVEFLLYVEFHFVTDEAGRDLLR